MYLKEEKLKTLFYYWLVTSFILIFCIIIIGGLTRLTDSGLSITKWELFKGILPPLNNETWIYYFSEYKKIPQFKILNSNMSLSDFKVIFYWEYFHRILARLIGLFFLIPLIYFYFSKKIKNIHLYTCFLVMFLILFQGLIGWYMVKSGLVFDVTVSHYRLSLHLLIAITIISIIFWLIKDFTTNKKKKFFKFSREYIPFQFLILLIFFQLILGAFVSGLDAGRIYQTWPMMGTTYFPNDIIIDKFSELKRFDNHSLVQFYHRNLAYLIILYVLILSFNIFKNRVISLYKPIIILNLSLLLQVFLGIITLLSNLNIYLASAHQIVGVILVLSALNLYYLKLK